MILSTETHKLKVASYVLFGDLTEDYSLGDSLSGSSEGLFQRGKGGAGYVGVFTEKNNVVDIKRSLLITKKQTSQVNDFSVFLCMGRSKSLGSLKLFPRYAS